MSTGGVRISTIFGLGRIPVVQGRTRLGRWKTGTVEDWVDGRQKEEV